MMNFYDYIEVQPVSVFSHLIGPNAKFNNVYEAGEHLKKIIKVAKKIKLDTVFLLEGDNNERG